MNPMPTIKCWSATGLFVVVIAIVGTPGCAITSTLGRSTRALEHTAQSMDRTRDVLQQSQRAMTALGSSLGSLREPMEKLGALESPLKNLHTLGALAPEVGGLTARMQGVETNLQRLEEPLANVAALDGPLDRVHALEKPLQTIAGFERLADKAWPAILGGLALWFGLTFFLVYGAFVTALRRYSSAKPIKLGARRSQKKRPTR
jgi:hypothetical protein